jgi:Ala-tRNA(Pro) deacylase
MAEPAHNAYTQLITLLDQHGVAYRLIDHPPEGQTERVSAMRGNTLAQAAKCIILIIKIGKKVTKYVLAVVPGNARVNVAAVKALFGGTYAAFASAEIAERLAGSGAGTILPFSFSPELELIADPTLLDQDELYFNAARLDRSIVLKTRGYLELAKPRLERIAEAGENVPA